MLVSDKRIDMRSTFKKLEQTGHVHVRHFSQDSTYDLFSFLSNFFFLNLSCQTLGAAYYAGVCGI